MVSKANLDNFDRLIRWSFYGLILMLPVGISFVSSFAGSAISFFLLKRLCLVMNNKPRGIALVHMLVSPAPNFFNKAVLFFVMAAFISVVFSQNHVLSVIGFVGKLLKGVFLYVSFLEAFSTVACINTFFCFWFLSALITGLSGLSQYFLGYDFIRQIPLDGGRISSSLRQANDFGAYIIAVCPLILSLLMNWDLAGEQMCAYLKRMNIRPFIMSGILFLVYVVLVVCLGLTLSRSAWVGFFVAIVSFGFFKKESIPFIILIIFGFMWIFSPIMVSTRDVSLLNDNVRSAQGHVSGQSMINYVFKNLGSGRWGYWREASGIIHDYPWWGSGLNTYSQMGSKYKITWGGYPHNSYLQLTAELGILGLGTFLFMIGSLFFYVIKEIELMKGYLRAVTIGALGSLFAYLIESFFDTTFYSVQLSVLMWLLIAVLVCSVGMNQLTKSAR